MSIMYQQPGELEQGFPEGALNNYPIYCIWFLPQPGLRNKGYQRKSSHSLYLPSDRLRKVLFPHTMTLSSACPEVLVWDGGAPLPRDTQSIPLNWKLRSPTSHLGLLMPLYQQAEKGITVLGWMIDQDYYGETGLSLSAMEVRKIMSKALEIF